MLKALQVANADDIIQPLMTPPVAPAGGSSGLPDAKATASAATGKTRTQDPLY
jgi:hypothetical protein